MSSKKHLVICESPAKIKPIGKYLGSNYIVKASVGHFRDLDRSNLSIDLENLEFSSVKTFKQDACSVCGTGRKIEAPKQELILEELCGRNMGKRTFSITPTYEVNLDVDDVTALAKEKGFLVENQGDLGISMRTNDLSVNFMKKGSAVVVGPNNEEEAISLYKTLLGTKSVSA